MKKKIILAGAVALALVLTGCGSESADLATAMETCLEAYEPALNWTEDLGGPEGACGNWIESQGEAAFIEFWSDREQWQPYIKNVYELEVLNGF